MHIYNKVMQALATVAMLTATACNTRPRMLPDSGGRPYQVLLAGDTDSIVYNALCADVPCLPQPEPMFDVSRTTPQNLKGVMLLARNIVVAEINPEKFSRASVVYERNVHAQPQLIVRIAAPSAGSLRSCVQDLARNMARHEANAQCETLAQRHNPKMEDEVKRMFGLDMLIPPDMTSYKRGKNFLWISNNSPTAMLNICAYGHDLSKRDSVMRVNIKGETDSMYMTTVHDRRTARHPAGNSLADGYWRGLWEMRGDAMGGPLVARTLWRARPRTPITVEGFVYAPGLKKRNLVMQLEAVLQTAKTSK